MENLSDESEGKVHVAVSKSVTVVSTEDKPGMTGNFLPFNIRRGSSGSTESTPLLNGSAKHAGPCYAYSYGGREDNVTESNSRPSTPSSESSDFDDRKHFMSFVKNVKVAILTGVILFAVVALSFIEVKENNFSIVAVTDDKPASINLSDDSVFDDPIIHLKAKGAFLPEKFINFSENIVTFTIVRKFENGTLLPVMPTWSVPIASTNHAEAVGSSIVEHAFNLPDDELFRNDLYQLVIDTNENDDYVSMTIDVTLRPELATDEILMATGILVGLYVLIIFDLVHRTLAAMIGATTAIAFLALVGERPSLEEVLSWLDVETLSLLFGMMVLVSILCQTGFFDYVAVVPLFLMVASMGISNLASRGEFPKVGVWMTWQILYLNAYRLARGRIWPLITSLCLVTAFLSAFLDNVTTILLMTAVTIRLCEVMNIDPKHVLIALIIFSNIGGAATPVGDPPNVIIISNNDIAKSGVTFGNYTLHMLPGVLLSLIGAYILIRIFYRDPATLRFSDPSEVLEVKREIDVWRKACHSLSGYSRDEDTVRLILKRKVTVLETLLRKKLYDTKIPEEDYRASLKELSNTYKITNMSLLIKSGVVILIVIMFFFLQSIPELNLSLGWIAILGAICLLILADFDELESVFGRVEWSTLLFFAALFVVMEALSKLKLLWYIGEMTQNIIIDVDEDHRLLVAIMLIIWVSALASSFIDNIPFTTVMVQIVTDISENKELNLPLTPLVYALAFGACLGGNGTLIGASANVVCAGLAEQHGYRFSFNDFFKVGFPIMLVTTALSSVYLLVCHVVLEWND